MNSLNLLSSRVIGQSPLTTRPRSRSQGEILRSKLTEELLRGRSYSDERTAQVKDQEPSTAEGAEHESMEATGTQTLDDDLEDEKQPLLKEHGRVDVTTPSTGFRRFMKRLADAITALLSTIGLPFVYVLHRFQDEEGNYSPIAPFTSRTSKSSARSTTAEAKTLSEKPKNRVIQDTKPTYSYASDSLTSTASDSESEQNQITKSTQDVSGSSEEPKPRRQSTRIKLLHNDEASQKRKRRSLLSEQPLTAEPGALTVDNLKSPTSASAALRVTRYPHAPNTPRPLVPRRQPSYANLVAHSPTRSLSTSPQQKTLVLDLDETLIHSLAKGGRMSTGHMVEVKLNVPVTVPSSVSGQQQSALLGPQHPILYYVHKRPHCDDFLRKVCKWYKLVVFTASVQEYADPVVDWLEQERKYFSGRYYRQHCTYRNGSYIKDLSSIEPDLSKVIILDNSPVSYIFHEDNAIPIEGWINDPTDNDLLHLIPMLEALQYVTDVRALLALRRGEAEAA